MTTFLLWLLLLLGLPAVSALAVGAWLINERVNEANRMPEYEPWHTAEFADLTAMDYADIKSFGELEKRERHLFEQVYGSLANRRAFCRYNPDSVCAPAMSASSGNDGIERSRPTDENLNGSFELRRDSPVGGILLVHGLRDSPYQTWAISNVFRSKGYYVLGLRLPGHGTHPNALANVRRSDWYAAVNCGVRLVRQEIGKDKPFCVGGVSTGCALALRYALTSVTVADATAVPTKLFFFSPLIGVANRAAVFSNLHTWISWSNYASKLKWLEIKPEFDPCRYNSLAKNAGYQVFKLAEENKRLIGKLSQAQGSRMPTLSCFASAADATVNVADIVWLFAELGNEQSELVLFDVNHFPAGDAIEIIEKQESTEGQERTGSDLFFEKNYFADLVGRFGALTKEKGTTARLNWVTNEGSSERDKLAPHEYYWPPGSTSYGQLDDADSRTQIPLQWPRNVFALSHICIPIAPDDRVYGESSILHQLQPKGERSVLAISMDDVTRLKFNPFFEYLKTKLQNMIDVA